MPSRSPKPSTAPLITVIIPVYNVAKFLERCISSVLNQTYNNLEIILVDDGSTDESGELCDTFAKKDPRIKVIHQKNRGLSGARNSALELAAGDYIAFIDSDDDVQLDLLERLYNLCHQNHAKLSICSFREIYPADSAPIASSLKAPGSVQAPSPNNSTTQTFDQLACLTAMLCEEDFSMSAWGKLYARELFDHDPFAAASAPQPPIRFPEGMLHEDVGTTYKLVLNSPKIAFTPAKLYNYYLNSGSITQQSFSMRKLDLITLTDEMCDHLEAWAQKRPSDVQAQIQNLTKKRRAHARFSILRQMVLVDPKTIPQPLPESNSLKSASKAPTPPEDRASFLATRREIVKYLRRHKNDILRNPFSSRRDRLAMLSLLAGLPVFKRAWLIYQKRKSQKQTNA